MNTFSLSAYLTSALTCLIGLFVLFRNPRNPVYGLFFIYSISITGWSFLTATHAIAKSYLISLWSARLMHIFVSFIPLLFYQFIFTLLRLKGKSLKALLVVGYLTATLLALLSLFTPLIVRDVVPKLGYAYFMNGGTLYWAVILHFFLFAVISLSILLMKMRSPEKRSRTDLYYLFFGSMVGYLFGSSCFLPVYNVTPFPYPYGSFAIAAYVVITAYAIVKHRLMDIDIALTRTGIFLVVYGFIIAAPLAVFSLGRNFLLTYFAERWWLVPLGLYGAMTMVGPFVNLLLQRKAEDRLLREQRQYQQTLLQASRGMTLVKNFDHLLNLVVHMLTRTIRITHASVYLLNDETKQYLCRTMRGSVTAGRGLSFSKDSPLIKHLKQTRSPLTAEEFRYAGLYGDGSFLSYVQADVERLMAAIIIPSFLRENLIGFLALGEKKSRRGYTEADLNTLSTLANQAALAIENCNFIAELEITQAQLFQAAKMADLGTMAGGIGHQINNRLHAIKLAAEAGILIRLDEIRKILPDLSAEKAGQAATACQNLEKHLRQISDDAKRGGEIVSRLLNFSRASEGFKPVSILEALDHCVRLWECKRDLSRVDFQREVPQDLPPVQGNFSQVEEVLFNLLDNAFDAILMKEEAWAQEKLPKPRQPAKGRISVTAAEVQKNGRGYLEVQVQDTGIGMTPETVKKLCVPFFTTKATSIKGTGLGLYVIKRMVDAHKGEIEVDSQYGEGTTFRILFPLTQGNAP